MCRKIILRLLTTLRRLAKSYDELQPDRKKSNAVIQLFGSVPNSVFNSFVWQCFDDFGAGSRSG